MGDRSSEGDARAYEKDDQRKFSQDELDQMKRDNRHFEGKQNSHKLNDPKDEQTIANKLEKESNLDDARDQSGKNKDEATRLAEQDATAPARMHGNEPSKGAKIDQELRDEEEEILKKKGAFGPK